MGRVDFVGAGLGEVVEIVEQGCASDVSAMGGDVKAQAVMMKLDLGKGAMWALRYTLPQGSYVVKMDVVQQRSAVLRK